MKFRKIIELIIGILAVTLSVLAFDVLLYLFEMLHEVSKPIYQELNKNGLSHFEVKHMVIIYWALLFATFLVFIFQFFKSLYDLTIKKFCDIAAEGLVNKLEKWTGK